MVKEKELPVQLDEWLAREELLWKQRSRSVKTKATKRRDKKQILQLQRNDGSNISEPDLILDEFY